MGKFQKGFFVGAATAAHQVEGNNIYSDCWAQEQLKYSIFQEPSLDAVDHYNRYQEDIEYMADAGMPIGLVLNGRVLSRNKGNSWKQRLNITAMLFAAVGKRDWNLSLLFIIFPARFG